MMRWLIQCWGKRKTHTFVYKAPHSHLVTYSSRRRTSSNVHNSNVCSCIRPPPSNSTAVGLDPLPISLQPPLSPIKASHLEAHLK